MGPPLTVSSSPAVFVGLDAVAVSVAAARLEALSSGGLAEDWEDSAS